MGSGWLGEQGKEDSRPLASLFLGRAKAVADHELSDCSPTQLCTPRMSSHPTPGLF